MCQQEQYNDLKILDIERRNLYLYVDALDEQARVQGKSTGAVYREELFDLLQALPENSLNIRQKTNQNKCADQAVWRTLKCTLGINNQSLAQACSFKLKIVGALQPSSEL